MPFRITGIEGEHRTEATRIQPASAAVLAMNWCRNGIDSVRITDNAGRSYSLESFRRARAQRGTSFTPF